jgi:hypothetical protein
MAIFIIAPTEDAPCQLCEKVDELRPYGPNGEYICFDCGMKDEKTTSRKLNEKLNPAGKRPGQDN